MQLELGVAIQLPVGVPALGRRTVAAVRVVGGFAVVTIHGAGAGLVALVPLFQQRAQLWEADAQHARRQLGRPVLRPLSVWWSSAGEARQEAGNRCTHPHMMMSGCTQVLSGLLLPCSRTMKPIRLKAGVLRAVSATCRSLKKGPKGWVETLPQPEGKNQDNDDLVFEPQLHLPHRFDGEAEDDGVCDRVEGPARVKQHGNVDAGPLDARVEDFASGGAFENLCERGGSIEQNHQYDQDNDANVEGTTALGRKGAPVEPENR